MSMRLVLDHSLTHEHAEIDRSDIHDEAGMHQWLMSLLTRDGEHWEHQLDTADHGLSADEVRILRNYHSQLASWSVGYVDPDASEPEPDRA